MLTNNWLNKLERRFGKFAIPNLMTILIFGMSIVAVVDIFSNPNYEFNLSSILAFDRAAIFRGQVWRVFTFVLMPPGYSLLTIVFTLYFYWLIGIALENQWGSFRFNVYYFSGMLASIIGGFITGYATNYHLNLTLFLAFAMLFPEHKVYFMFFIPMKMKFLALIDVLFLVFEFVISGWNDRISILIALAVFLVFFMPDIIYQFKMLRFRIRNKKRKNNPGGIEQKKTWKNHWWDDHDNNPFQ